MLGEVCGWVNAVATKPVWAKMTPNITDITAPARVAFEKGRNKDAQYVMDSIMFCLDFCIALLLYWGLYKKNYK